MGFFMPLCICHFSFLGSIKEGFGASAGGVDAGSDGFGVERGAVAVARDLIGQHQRQDR